MSKIWPFILLCAFVGGCGIVSVLGTPTSHEIKIAPEYDLTAALDKKVMVVVEQPLWLNTTDNLRFYVTEAANQNLTDKAKLSPENIISYSNVAKIRSKTGFNKPIELASEAGVDLVLVISIEDYRLATIEDSDYVNGDMRARAKLIDVAAGQTVWPSMNDSRLVKVGFDMEKGGMDKGTLRLCAALAYCTTRYLYPVPSDEFKRAEDRSGINWENYK
ncbi:MAG: hypothetical protein PHF37_04870 [Phycisphaerae bacterium]|nr:hypothetical protein [Phycisphaerae bacterium]